MVGRIDFLAFVVDDRPLAGEIGSSIFLLFIVQRATAEYVVTIMSLCVGVTLIGLVMLASWYANR